MLKIIIYPLYLTLAEVAQSSRNDDLTRCRSGVRLPAQKIIFFGLFVFPYAFYLLAGFNLILLILLLCHSFTRCCDKGISSNKISLSRVNKTAVWGKIIICGLNLQRGDEESVQMSHLCPNPPPTPLSVSKY